MGYRNFRSAVTDLSLHSESPGLLGRIDRAELPALLYSVGESADLVIVDRNVLARLESNPILGRPGLYLKEGVAT